MFFQYLSMASFGKGGQSFVSQILKSSVWPSVTGGLFRTALPAIQILDTVLLSQLQSGMETKSEINAEIYNVETPAPFPCFCQKCCSQYCHVFSTKIPIMRTSSCVESSFSIRKPLSQSITSAEESGSNGTRI